MSSKGVKRTLNVCSPIAARLVRNQLIFDTVMEGVERRFRYYFTCKVDSTVLYSSKFMIVPLLLISKIGRLIRSTLVDIERIGPHSSVAVAVFKIRFVKTPDTATDCAFIRLEE